MKILLPRFIANNVGDLMSRQGLLQCLKEKVPDARTLIVTTSPQSFFPSEVEAIPPGLFKDALPRMEQLKKLKRGDVVLWACGHDMTDESSALLIPHMYFKLLTYKLMGLEVHVVAQGAGPLKTAWGRFFVRRIVKLADSVSLRDPISLALVAKAAGVPESRLHLSADTAVLATEIKKAEPGSPLVLGVNVRRWHHLTGGVIPYEYKARMGIADSVPGQDIMDEFISGMAAFLDNVVEEHDLRIKFIPMYPPGKEPWEDDASLGEAVIRRMRYSEAAENFAELVPPEQMVDVFAGVDVMLGVRLHSTIVPTSMGIPALHLAYSPKGFAYYERLGMSECCMPLEAITVDKQWDVLREKLDSILAKREHYEDHLRKVMPEMRQSAANALDVVIKSGRAR